MENSRMLRGVWLIALIPAFVVAVSAQRARPNPEATRRTINNETYRELMNKEREHKNFARDDSAPTRVLLLKQNREDFKAIQSINNKMMAEVYATEAIDYNRTSTAIAQINTKATRLKNNLSLPDAKNVKRKDLTVSGAKEFKSALLLMDRSIMSFVTNPMFKEQKVMEVESATQASQDLADIIKLSATLKKIADNLKSSTPRQ